MVKKNLGRILGVLGMVAAAAWGETTYGKTIYPFRFYSVEDPADTLSQLETWNLLVKYKLFARGASDGSGIIFAGQNIFITDTVGYTGSATGNFQMGGNMNHALGGPVLFGGKFSNGDGNDTLLTGPVRFLGRFEPSGNSKNSNVFRGSYCLDGGRNEATTDPGIAKGGKLLETMECKTDEYVPFVDTTLDVPEIDTAYLKTVKWHSAISANGKTAYLYVPPYTETDSASFNYFVESLNFGNNGNLIVIMPPSGRLTKVFLKGSINGLGGTAGNNITVSVANSLNGWNAKDSTWDTSDITEVSNSEYQGNLLFFTPNDLSMGAGSKKLQGTFISGGKIQFAQNTDFAGQLLAKVISIDADFQAKDFRYVPFDPPILNIDPTALAAGKFLENDTPQEIPIHLSTAPVTGVSFNYCFVLSSEANSNTKLLANAADFNTEGMPICTVNSDGSVSGDYGSVTFLAGKTTPRESVKISPKKDGTVEGDESFKLYAFNMSGAVMSGNQRSGYFTLYIKDSDTNVPPEFEKPAYDFTVDENSPVGTLVGTILATDKNVGDIVRYKVSSGDSSLFALDSNSGKITVKLATLDYESKDTTFTVYVYATDGELTSNLVAVTIHVKDVNEKPSLADTSFAVREDAKVGTEIGTVVGFDPDSLNVKFSTISYKLVGSSAEGVFKVSSDGTISLAAAVDYEKLNQYTLKIAVSDGEFSDTAAVKISVLDVNEAPSISPTTVSIPEDCAGCAAGDKIPATDPDGDKLVYEISKDTSGLFTIDGSGLVSLKKDATLDYETDSVYTITVKVSDPEGLADSATITVKVQNKTEKVEITRVESGDSSWTKPDTIYTNNQDAYIEWTTPAGKKDSTVRLVEGKNVVTVRYQDGSDQVVIFLSTKIPTVSITADSDSAGRASGVTIVEEKDPSDTASYVRSDVAWITVTAIDSALETPKKITHSFKVSLDTVSLSSSDVKKAEASIGKVEILDESDLPAGKTATHSVIGKDLVQVSYKDTLLNGTVVTITYYTDTDGNRLKNSDGDEYYEVSTEVKKDGKTVTLTYTVDQLGNVVTDSDGKTLYTVSYPYTATGSNGEKYTVTVSYTMNSDGKKTADKDGNLSYTVSYVYVDSYGNSAKTSTAVIVDRVPPKVKILSPEDKSVVSNMSIEVKWTVDGIEQDTLTYQGLNDGKNLIIRAYRDKAGNEAADTVIVILRAGKMITVEVEDPLIAPDKKTVEKFTSVSNSKEGTSYALSVYNAKTSKEEETQAGSKGKVSEGSGKEPYEGMSGKHLGVTLSITAQAPAIDETGTLSTLASIVENGYVALDSGGGWDRTTTTLEDYVENYCSAEFQKEYDSVGTSASLYATKISIQIWLFTTLGEYVDDYEFSQDITPDYVDQTGGIQMWFELKPDGDGYLKNSDGRLLATGAYIYKTDVKIRSKLRCDLPDLKKGFIRKDTDRILSKWGYRRPNN